MSQQSQGTSSASPADVPMKRKRGRPRKDEGLVQGENKPSVPGSDSVKKNKQSVGTNNVSVDDMVGQLVSGVIEGSFDAGYLLNVKVGDTDTHLRGVVFLPGRFTPITPANDVAPNAKMYKRKEIPIPALNPQSQLHAVVSPSEPINKQPVEPKNHVPKLSDQVQPSKLQSSIPIAGETQSTSVMIPPANKMPINETGLSLGEKVLPQQTLESVPKNQTASVMEQLKYDELVEKDEVQQELEASMLMKGPNIDVEAPKESEPVSVPSVDILLGSETVNQEPQVEHKALSSELKPNELVHDEVKSPNIEHNQTPLFAEPVSKSSEPIGINILMEKQASSKEDTPQDTELNLGNNITSGDDTSLLNGRLVSNAATITETGSNSAPITSLPVLTFGGKASMSSEPIGINILMEKQASSKEDTPQDTELNLGNNIISGDDTSLLNGRLVSDAATITETGSNSAPITSLPVLTFGGEAISSELKVATEGSSLPSMIDSTNL